MAGGFEGKWHLEKSENFDEYMKAVGVSLVTRKLGNATKPVVTITKKGDEFSYKSESTVKTTVMDFKLGQEFKETTADGRTVQSTITADGPKKWIHEQKGDVPSTIIRELTDDNTMFMTLKAKDVVSTRVYKRA
jgi:type II secretory pathway component HofQ